MYQKDFSLYCKMNLQTDAVIINQCDIDKAEQEEIDGHAVRMYSYSQRGVGKSRNNALLNAEGDICLLADDDVIYVDGYEKIILDAFDRYPDGDVILFRVDSLNPDRPIDKIKKSGRLREYHATSCGTWNVAFRRERIQKSNIWFSLLFGGGAKYGSGEDSLFIHELFRKKLHVYGMQEKIANVEQSASTWFQGYTSKYFKDKGAAYRAIYGSKTSFLMPIFALRMKRKNLGGVFEIYSLLRAGEKEYCNV